MATYSEFGINYTVKCDSFCKYADDEKIKCDTALMVKELFLKRGIESGMVIISACKYCEIVEEKDNG
tara:strand:- start:360 stop:560 length:201 start_codon:yes stop_codon:yes gene_type:complete